MGTEISCNNQGEGMGQLRRANKYTEIKHKEIVTIYSTFTSAYNHHRASLARPRCRRVGRTCNSEARYGWLRFYARLGISTVGYVCKCVCVMVRRGFPRGARGLRLLKLGLKHLASAIAIEREIRQRARSPPACTNLHLRGSAVSERCGGLDVTGAA